MTRTIRWTRWLCPLLLACAAAAHAGPTGGSDADRAAALYDQGKRHFDIGEYTAAIASWKQSYLLSSEPLLLFNIGQAYRLAGNCAQANRFYFTYKRAVPRPTNRTELEHAMAKCAGVAPAVGEDDASPNDASSPGAAGTGALAASTANAQRPATGPEHPATGPERPAAGPNSPAAGPSSPATGPSLSPTGGAAGAGAPANATGLTSSSSSLSAGAHADGAHPERGRGLRVAGLVTGAIGLAAGATAAVLGVEAGQHASTVHDQPPGSVWTGSLPGEQSAGQTAQTGARVLAAVAGAAVIGGGVMWWLGHRAGRTHVDVAIAPGHTEVSLSCVF